MLRTALLLFIVNLLSPASLYADTGESFPHDSAVRISNILESSDFEVELNEGHLHDRNDVVMVYLRIEYSNSGIFVPIAHGTITSCSKQTCVVKMQESTDAISSANWVVINQEPEALREAMLDDTLKGISEMLATGRRGEAMSLIEEATNNGVPSHALTDVRARLDINKATTHDGLTFEQLVSSQELRSILSAPKYLDVLIIIMNKENWLSNEERQWVLESLPERTDTELNELMIVL